MILVSELVPAKIADLATKVKRFCYWEAWWNVGVIVM